MRSFSTSVPGMSGTLFFRQQRFSSEPGVANENLKNELLFNSCLVLLLIFTFILVKISGWAVALG